MLKATSLQDKITLRPPTSVSVHLIGTLLLVAGGYLMVKTETFMCPDYIFPSPEPFLVVVH